MDKKSFLEKLFPNPFDALAVFLAFVILLLVVFYFAYKPAKELMKKRSEYIEGKIKDAEAKQAQAINLLESANSEYKSKKIEALEIVEDAKKDAIKEKELILETAKKEKEAMVNKAKEEIEQEIEASKDDLHREIVSVALDASRKVLEREVTGKDNEKLIDSFIDDLKEDK